MIFRITDNIGNEAEADSPDAAALAVKTLLLDNPGTVNTVVVTSVTTAESLESVFNDIVAQANERMGFKTD